MISTHWSQAHQPSPRDLRLLDILARQAADLLERTMADDVLRAREQELQVLNLELRHRLKNNLAIVQTLSRQTLKGVEDRGAVDALLERLIALGAAHDVLYHEGWTSTTIEQVSRASLLAVAGLERIAFDGPAITIGPRAAVAMSLVVHELATNAIKYGALSVSHGEVDLAWRIDGGLLKFSWEERGGPAAAAPTHAGFGSRLITMGFSPGSKVDRDFAASGLRVRITAPLAELTEDLALPNA
jgi:two-component sensor histidine kinase